MKKIGLLLLIIGSFKSIGQTISPENRIVVIGMAEVEIPADKVVFQVGLTFRDENDVQKAYNQHKQAENKLVTFLKDLHIPNKNVVYTLINVGRSYPNEDYQNPRKLFYTTNQTISITVENIKDYSDFMLKLISAGFNNVEGSFISSRIDEFHNQLIEKAIDMAMKKAQVMANSSKRHLGKIVKVTDTNEDDPNFSSKWNMYETVKGETEVQGGTVGLLDITSISQTIKKSMSVKVVFELK